MTNYTRHGLSVLFAFFFGCIGGFIVAVFGPLLFPASITGSSLGEDIVVFSIPVFSLAFGGCGSMICWKFTKRFADKEMDEANHSRMSTLELLGATWRVWRSRAGMFVLLMGLPTAALLLAALIINYVIAPHPESTPLREVWLGMSELQKVVVIVLFFGTFAVEYRAQAASAFATQEIQSERSVGILQALRSVRRKQLRLFWMVMLASMLTGPLGLIIVGPLLAFGTAPAFPVAILENMTAFAAIKRGNALAKGGYGRIALLVAMWLGLGIAGVVGLVSFLAMLQERFARPWFLRPVPLLGFWLIFLIPQWYMIALTLNYLDQRGREGKTASADHVQVPDWSSIRT